ncbi:MAG: N-acetylglutaminylglutamine amidotransferase [Gammaproteobacteria bacterium]
MCGISGAVDFSGVPPSIATVEAMTQRLAARGPDGFGLSCHQHVAFGHRRLKIIDLSDRSRQPLVDSELGLVVAFNGCIYNYRELRQELEGHGHRFFSQGDTEVIAKAWKTWGRDCVSRFNGMFAFAVHDIETGTVALARDRLGIKPLYVIDDSARRRLYFASTLPALLAVDDVDTSIDPVALHHYLSFHAVVPPPRTILSGVRKVPPATVIEYTRDGRRSEHRYWSLEFADAVADRLLTDEELISLTEESLRRAVQRRMVADVPVGVLLSGGLDSSLIVGMLAESGQRHLHTFSIGFEDVRGERGNEFEYSDIVARHFDTTHTRLHIDSSQILDRLPEAIAAMSEPMVSHDSVAFFLLAEQVKKQVNVVQSGQGADEIFAGYHWYPPMMKCDSALDAYRQAFFDRDHAGLEEILEAGWLGEDYSSAFVADHFAADGAPAAIDKALRLDIQIMLADDPVKRVDNMTMASGLEARVPFLDHELVEVAARVPPRMKIAEGGKGILKTIARKVVPHAVIDRPKGYFPVPALKYIEGDLLEQVGDVLTGRRARERGIVQQAYVEKLLAAPHDHITTLGGSKLWQLGLLEMWLQTNGV